MFVANFLTHFFHKLILASDSSHKIILKLKKFSYILVTHSQKIIFYKNLLKKFISNEGNQTCYDGDTES